MGLLEEARSKKAEPKEPTTGLLAEARQIKAQQPAVIEGADQMVSGEQPEMSLLGQIDSAILNTGPGRFLAELAGSANKTLLDTLDFFGANNVNAALELMGSDERIPTLSGEFAEQGFMEPGLARDITQGVGGLAPVAASLTPVVGRNLASAGGIAAEALGVGSAKVAAPVKAASTAVSDSLPSKAKEAAKLPLLRESGDVAAAGFKLDDAGRVVKDKVQQQALKAGIDEGAVAMISASNKATKGRMKEMVEVLEKGRGNLEFRNFNPPQRVIGEAIKDRLSIIQKANRDAAGQLDTVANSLQGQKVDVSPAMERFVERLGKERITVNPNGSLNFTGSSIEGEDLKKAQNILQNVFRRLYNTEDPTKNALRVHDAKKFIDEQVSYGKSQAGLSGRMENIVKELRSNLDGILDQNFPEYDRVNTIYSETRTVIDELQSLAGSKVDLFGGRVDKALGTMSRKVLSNYNTGTAMEDLFDALDDVARRYSTPLTGSVDDSLRKLVSLEAEIRKMFPTAIKPNTFQGEIGREVARGAADVATGNKADLFRRGFEKAAKIFSKDDEAKIKSLKDLLSEKTR